MERAVVKTAAALCATLILALSFLAANPSLHQLLHADATNPDHQCAISLFARAQVLPAVIVIGVWVIFLAPLRFVALPERILFLLVSRRLPPSCGPPVLLP